MAYKHWDMPAPPKHIVCVERRVSIPSTILSFVHHSSDEPGPRLTRKDGLLPSDPFNRSRPAAAALQQFSHPYRSASYLRS